MKPTIAHPGPWLYITVRYPALHKTVSRCLVLRQLRSIRHSVQATTFQTLIVSFVLSRMDCGNAVLAGLPAYLFRRLQSVMNAAARLIYRLRHSDHISNALITLHWHRAQDRVRWRMAVLMYSWKYTDIAKFAGHLPHRYGNSRAIWDHTVLPATRQR